MFLILYIELITLVPGDLNGTSQFVHSTSHRPYGNVTRVVAHYAGQPCSETRGPLPSCGYWPVLQHLSIYLLLLSIWSHLFTVRVQNTVTNLTVAEQTNLYTELAFEGRD